MVTASHTTPVPAFSRPPCGGDLAGCPSAHTVAARAAFLSQFEREVDPTGQLPKDARPHRAEHARKAYFARLALASVKARPAG